MKSRDWKRIINGYSKSRNFSLINDKQNCKERFQAWAISLDCKGLRVQVA